MKESVRKILYKLTFQGNISTRTGKLTIEHYREWKDMIKEFQSIGIEIFDSGYKSENWFSRDTFFVCKFEDQLNIENIIVNHKELLNYKIDKYINIGKVIN